MFPITVYISEQQLLDTPTLKDWMVGGMVEQMHQGVNLRLPAHMVHVAIALRNHGCKVNYNEEIIKSEIQKYQTYYDTYVLLKKLIGR